MQSLPDAVDYFTDFVVSVIIIIIIFFIIIIIIISSLTALTKSSSGDLRAEEAEVLQSSQSMAFAKMSGMLMFAISIMLLVRLCINVFKGYIMALL